MSKYTLEFQTFLKKKKKKEFIRFNSAIHGGIGALKTAFRIQDLQYVRRLHSVTSIIRGRVRTMTSIFHRISRVSPEDAQSLYFRIFVVLYTRRLRVVT